LLDLLFALHEKWHIDDFRAGITALSISSGDELKRRHPARLDRRRIVSIKGSDLSQGPNSESLGNALGSASCLKVGIECRNATENSEYDLREQSIRAAAYGPSLSFISRMPSATPIRQRL
jgi:hypothetical protein